MNPHDAADAPARHPAEYPIGEPGLFGKYAVFWARIVLRWRRPFVIGITGTVGKSTAAHFVHAVLADLSTDSERPAVNSTVLNMNDDEGLALTILGYRSWVWQLPRRLTAAAAMPFRALMLAASPHYPRILVLECAAARPGNVARLAAIAPPQIAVVTTIAPNHFDEFLDTDQIAEEKAALTRAVPPSGLIIVGEDHEWVPVLERNVAAPVVRVSGRGAELSKNVARVIGRRLGVPDTRLESALANVRPPARRLTQIDTPLFTVIDDTWNASPAAMMLALDTIAERAGPGHRKIAVLGGMTRLGENSAHYHREAAERAKTCVDMIIGVGDLAGPYDGDHWFESTSECVERIASLVRPGDWILVKGGAYLSMDAIVRRLVALGSSADGSGRSGD